LKDLRNRIASVKATRKITKAMQMVAAAKLRRAQEAAEARAPMPSAWARFWPTCRQLERASGRRSPLMAGTGKDDVHLLSSCTAERGLCGGFNGNIAKLAREHTARELIAHGKTVKILTVGKKGYDVLRREYAT
jgi:F-type H+-transporting ATPase subunit gamma